MTSPSTPTRSTRIVDVALAGVLGSGLAGPLALAAALACAAALSRPDAPVVVAAALAALLGSAHVGASWLRAWRSDLPRARPLLIASGLVAALAAAFAVAGGAVALEIVWSVALLILPCHVALQVHRVTLVVVAGAGSEERASTRPQVLARVARSLASVLLALSGVVALFAGPRVPLFVWGGALIAPDVAASAASVPVAVAIALAVAALALVSVSIVVVRDDARRPVRATTTSFAFALVAYASAASIWIAPLAIDRVVDPRSSTLSLLLCGHAAQLIWLALRAESRVATLRGRSFDPIAHVGLALVLAAAVLVDAPWIASRIAGVDLVAALLATSACFAIQHALVDAVVWRLRAGGEIQRALSDVETAPAPHGRAQVSNKRALAFAVPGMLIAFGLAVDVAQQALVDAGGAPRLHSNNRAGDKPRLHSNDAGDKPRLHSDEAERALTLAELMHPTDSRVLFARARSALVAGEREVARARLGDIEKLPRAFSPDAAAARVTLCFDSAGDIDAVRCLAGAPAYVDDRLDVLVVRARIGLRMGNPDLAKRHAARALAIHGDDDPLALAALGEVEQRLREPGAHARLSRAFDLARARAVADADPLVADPDLLETGLALADTERVRRDASAALAVLDRVIDGATRTDRPRAALLALGMRARILDERGDARGALDAYQRALQIARYVEAPADEALLWLDFGGLLARSSSSMEARYACVLKASARVDATDEAHPEKKRLQVLATAARAELESALDAVRAAVVRNSVDEEAAKALSLTYPGDEAASSAR